MHDIDFNHFPDGLNLAAIDALMSEVYAEADRAAEPTTALLDDTARARRERRAAQRALGNTVRVLRAHTDPSITSPAPIEGRAA